MSQSSSSSSSSSSSATTLPLPMVQGFTMSDDGPVAKISHLIYWPKPDAWDAMLAQIRLTGDKTASTTKSGRNHPCQTSDLRCDHQGDIGNYSNTQVQLGGRDVDVDRSKPTQSTTVTQVNVHHAAYNKAMINDALARAHDWSFTNHRVVRIDVTGGAQDAVRKLHKYSCSNCGNTYTAFDSISLGVQVGSYPPACPNLRCKDARLSRDD